MTSKNFFWSRMKEDGKRRLWLFALFSFIMVCAYPLAAALILSRYGEDAAMRQQTAFNLLGLNNGFTVFFLTLGGVVCAMNGFSWLYSRKKADMYLALPVSAKSRFLMIYMNGLLLYFIPYMISALLGFLVAAGMGAFTGGLFVEALFAAAVGFVYFLAVYNLMLLAVMLTGNKLAAALLGGVFFLYDMMMRLVLDEYSQLYFSTFSGRRDTVELLSPLYRLAVLLDKGSFAVEEKVATVSEVLSGRVLPMLSGLSILLLEAVLFGMLAYSAYKRRPMEASGKAIAFPALKGPLKVFLIVLSGLLGSCIVSEVSDSRAFYIAALGLVIGVLLCQAVLEIIYEGDLRAFLSHKKSFAVGTEAVVLCHLFFAFDISGYNTWVPEAGQVESAAIEIGFENQYMFDYVDEEGNPKWINEYGLENMEIKDVSGILSLAKDGMGKEAREQDPEKQLHCTVKYNMKNGKERYRDFFIDYEMEKRVLDILFANQDYKKGKDPVLAPGMDAVFGKSVAYYINGLQEEELLDKNALELMQAYQEDVYEMSFTDVKDVLPCGMLELRYKNPNGEQVSLQYPVFPSYIRTVGYLREKGIELYLRIEPEAVDSIRVISYNEEDSDLEMGPYAGDSGKWDTAYADREGRVKEAEYTDRVRMEELLNAIYPSVLADWRYVHHEKGKELRVTLEPSDRKEAFSYHWNNTDFILESGDMPDFVKEDLEK